jgi:hypothetical protein
VHARERQEEAMAELTPLDEKLAEVLGLAQAAQAATKKVTSMEGADDFEADLERMQEEAAETERRTTALVDGSRARRRRSTRRRGRPSARPPT